MKRVLVLGPGGAGKSVFARALAEQAGLPVVELDQLFWKTDLVPTPPDEWAAVQRELTTRPSSILDGDLGPHDVVDVRLSAADTIIVLDVSRWRCAWRALRRSHERLDFWRWLWTWRRKSLPTLKVSIQQSASDADVFILRTPAELDRLLVSVRGKS